MLSRLNCCCQASIDSWPLPSWAAAGAMLACGGRQGVQCEQRGLRWTLATKAESGADMQLGSASTYLNCVTHQAS